MLVISCMGGLGEQAWCMRQPAAQWKAGRGWSNTWNSAWKWHGMPHVQFELPGLICSVWYRLLQRCYGAGADIVKFATMANDITGAWVAGQT